MVVVDVVVVGAVDELLLGGVHDVGGLLCGVVVTVGSAGGCCGFCAAGCCGFCSSGRERCLRSASAFAAPPALDDAGVETVTITVDVLPSGATLVDVMVSATPAFGSGVARGPSLASIDATVANIVATTTPPAASMTTVDTFFFGASETEGDCG